MNIDWQKFKSYKSRVEIKEGHTNLDILVGFLKASEGLYVYEELFDAINADELGGSMLDKNGIKSADALMRFCSRKI
ncbi:MAG: hypothetical protein PHE67_08570 [Campylobacterales bacterium]|nr:hypothetical protein [Campylobacterales bacterium]